MTGVAKDNNGQPLTGASVIAVHTPSGTTYSTIAGKDGVFNILNSVFNGIKHRLFFTKLNYR